MVNFTFGIDVVYNPGNAITGLNQLNTAMLDVKTTAAAFAQGFGNMGGAGLDNLLAKGERTTTFLNGLRATIPTISNSFAGISNGANQAGTAIAELGTKAQGASSSIQSYANASSSVSANVEKFSAANINLGNSMGTLGSRAGTLAGQLNQFNGPLSNLFRQVSQMNTPIANLGNTITQTASKFSAGLAPAVAAVGGPLNNLNAQLAGTTGGLNNIGSAGGNAATGLGRLRELFTGNRGLVFGASALFGTLTGIAFELQLVNDANSQVAQSQSVLNGLVASGQQGTTQYSQAQQALAKDQRFLEFSTRNLALAFTNLIPDALLLANGLINLSAKFQTTGTAATTLGSGFTTLQTVTTATGTTMTTLNGTMTATSATMGVLNTSQTALTAEATVMRDLYAGVPPIMAAVRTEETALTGVTDTLAASETALGVKTAATRDVMATVPEVMSLTRAEEGLLAGENAVLGDSFLAMQTKATTAVGGIRGLFSKVGGAIGGFLGGTGGAVLGPIALAGAFVGATELIIQGAKETDQKILESGKIMDAANKTTANSLDVLIGKVTSGTATMTEAWNAFALGVQRSAGIITKAQATVPAPSLLGEKNVAAGTAGKTQPEGFFAGIARSLGLGNIVSPEAQAPPVGIKLPPSPTAPKPEPPKPPPTIQEIQQMREAQIAKDQAILNTGKQLQIPNVGTFPLTKQFTTEDVSKLTDIIPRMTSTIDLMKSGTLTEEQMGEATKSLMADYDGLADVLGITGFSVKSFTGASKDSAKVEEEKQKVYQKSQDDMNAYNKLLDAQPKILQDVGVATKQLSDDEIERQDIIRSSAAVFIGQANAQKVSLGVAEQAAVIGKKLTDGLIEQRDSIEAENLVWSNMGTIVKGTNQTMGEWITSQQKAILGSINVTAALTNQTQTQFLVNEGLIAGKEAAKQFLEQTVSGVAQNEQYVTSLEGIAQTMGVVLPTGIKLTAAELENVIFEMRRTGDSAIATSAVLQNAFKPATEVFGKLVSAGVEGSKEFGKAWKDLDLSLPKGLQNAVKDFSKDMTDMQKQFGGISSNIDVVFGAMQSGFKLTESQAASFGDTLSKQLGKLSESNPALQRVFEPIKIFLDNLGKGEQVAGLTKVMELWTSLQAIFDDGIQTGDVETAMKAVNDILGAQVSVVTKAEDAWKKYFSTQKEVAKGADQFKKGISGLLDFEKDFGKKEESEKDLKDLRSGKKVLPDLPGTVHGTPEKRPIAPQATPSGPVVGGGDITGKGDLSKLWEGAGGKSGSQQIVTEVTNMQSAIAKVLPQIISTVNATGTGIIKAFSKTFETVENLTGTFIKAEAGAFNALSTVGIVGTAKMGASMINSFTKTFEIVMGLTGTFIKQMATALGALSTVGILGTAKMGASMILSFANTYKVIMENTGTFIKAMDGAFDALQVSGITHVATMSKGVQTEISTMFSFVTDVVKTMEENVTAEIDLMNVTSVTETATMSKGIQTEVSNMYTFVTEVIKKMDEDVVAAIEDMAKRGGKAAASFASDMESSLGKVEDAANNAASAVSNLADEVASLDGSSAVVTITTKFETSGSPPSGGTKAGSKAQGMLADVISAASAKTISSFAEGGIQTIQGPQLAFFGDNPGGIETHAFIPHDNPFPILKKLVKMFSKNSSAGEIVGNALGRAEEMWIDLHLQIDNIMDGEKVSRQIVRKTFKKMRTRP